MKVKQLRKLLEGVDDDVQILIPHSHEFDGIFYSPCSLASGITQVSTDDDLTEEDIAEMELLDKPVPEEDAFLLLPCGFGEDTDEDHRHELN